MIVVKEYTIQRRPWVTVGIHNGWKPLTPRLHRASGDIILPAIVDTEEPECAEVIRLVREGSDIQAATEGLDAAPLGYVDGVYLFLDLPPEDTSPVRRIGRPDLMEEDEWQGLEDLARRLKGEA